MLRYHSWFDLDIVLVFNDSPLLEEKHPQHMFGIKEHPLEANLRFVRKTPNSSKQQQPKRASKHINY